MDAVDAPLASFEAKWAAVRPEFALALKFAPPAMRRLQSAFGCLVFELEYAVFSIRDVEPATIKLQWWAEEFARAAAHETRHPLSQALATSAAFAGITPARWHAVVIGAFAQRDPLSAADAAALLAHHAQLYAPLAAIEMQLLGVDAATATAAMCVARALRETARLPLLLQDGHLPLPLDLLARHRLARADLSSSSRARAEALREWFGKLAADLGDLQDAAGAATPGVWHAAMIAADRHRALRAGRAAEPLAAIERALGHVSPRAAWATWRAARRSRI